MLCQLAILDHVFDCKTRIIDQKNCPARSIMSGYYFFSLRASSVAATSFFCSLVHVREPSLKRSDSRLPYLLARRYRYITPLPQPQSCVREACAGQLGGGHKALVFGIENSALCPREERFTVPQVLRFLYSPVSDSHKIRRFWLKGLARQKYLRPAMSRLNTVR